MLDRKLICRHAATFVEKSTLSAIPSLMLCQCLRSDCFRSASLFFLLLFCFVCVNVCDPRLTQYFTPLSRFESLQHLWKHQLGLRLINPVITKRTIIRSIPNITRNRLLMAKWSEFSVPLDKHFFLFFSFLSPPGCSINNPIQVCLRHRLDSKICRSEENAYIFILFFIK